MLSSLYLKDRYESVNNLSVEDDLFFFFPCCVLHVLQQGDDVMAKRLCQYSRNFLEMYLNLPVRKGSQIVLVQIQKSAVTACQHESCVLGVFVLHKLFPNRTHISFGQLSALCNYSVCFKDKYMHINNERDTNRLTFYGILDMNLCLLKSETALPLTNVFGSCVV